MGCKPTSSVLTTLRADGTAGAHRYAQISRGVWRGRLRVAKQTEKKRDGRSPHGLGEAIGLGARRIIHTGSGAGYFFFVGGDPRFP